MRRDVHEAMIDAMAGLMLTKLSGWPARIAGADLALRRRAEAVLRELRTEIAEACTKAGHKLARAEVRLPTGPLRTVGDHTITLHLHTDIDVQLPVVITAED